MSVEKIEINDGGTQDRDFILRPAVKAAFGLEQEGVSYVVLAFKKTDGRERLCAFSTGPVRDALAMCCGYMKFLSGYEMKHRVKNLMKDIMEFPSEILGSIMTGNEPEAPPAAPMVCSHCKKTLSEDEKYHSTNVLNKDGKPAEIFFCEDCWQNAD